MLIFLALLYASTLLGAQAIVWTPFYPGSLPLAIRSPYLNIWLPQGNQTHPISNSWPFFWPTTVSTDQRGWKCILLVDNVQHYIMGVGVASDNPGSANVTSVVFTPTTTSFNMTAGPVNVQLEFLSAIEVADLTRMSLPFSYIYVTVTSADGNSHDVKVTMAFTAGETFRTHLHILIMKLKSGRIEMISGDRSFAANASAIVNNDIVALQMQLQDPLPFVEIHDHPQDATAYIATFNSPSVTYQVVSQADTQPKFISNLPVLSNTVDSNYSSHPLNSPYDNYEILVDLGSVIVAPSTAVFTVGITRDPSIKYTNFAGEEQLRHPYYRVNFSTPEDLMSFVVNDFNRSLDSAKAFDSNLITAASNISSAYAELLSLLARQSMGTLDVTVSQLPDRSFNMTDVKVFVKDMGGMGSGGVNAVSVVYAALPMYLYLASDLLGRILEPLLESQDDPSYTLPYAAQHLGVNYPNATAQNTAHNFGVEESANMLILSLAHAQATNDKSMITRFYNLLGSWTKYLITNALSPNAQQTSPLDGISAINQTNLALKGVIGIAAMGRISTLAGQTQDASTYNSTARSYIQQWLTYSKSADGAHISTAYGDDSSAGLLYNLFADKILRLNLVPDEVYQIQTDLYRSLQAGGTAGVPLATSNRNLSRTDWTMFAAAASSDNTTRDAFVTWIHKVASANTNNTPLGVTFDPTSNVIIGGINSPAHGSIYALLSLSGNIIDIDNKTATNTTQTGGPSSPHGKSLILPILCGIAGGVLVLVMCAVVLIKLRKRKRSTVILLRPMAFATRKATESPSLLNPEFRSDRDQKGRTLGDIPAALEHTDHKIPRQTEVSVVQPVAPEIQRLTTATEERGQRVDEHVMEMEIQVLRAQVNRLMERRRASSSSSRSSFGLESPPSYNSAT